MIYHKAPKIIIFPSQIPNFTPYQLKFQLGAHKNLTFNPQTGEIAAPELVECAIPARPTSCFHSPPTEMSSAAARNWATSFLLFAFWAGLMYYVFFLAPNQTPVDMMARLM